MGGIGHKDVHKICFRYGFQSVWVEGTSFHKPRSIVNYGLGFDVPGLRKEVNESEETLGVFLNPSKDMNAKQLFQNTQIIKWESPINKSNLIRPDIYLAYDIIFLMMVTHHMMVTAITADKFKPTQTILDKTYKTIMGLNIHFPNAVYRETPGYRGLAVVSPLVHQGYKQMQFRLGSVRNGDIGGEIVIQIKEYLQLEADTYKSTLHPHKNYEHAG